MLRAHWGVFHKMQKQAINFRPDRWENHNGFQFVSRTINNLFLPSLIHMPKTVKKHLIGCYIIVNHVLDFFINLVW